METVAAKLARVEGLRTRLNQRLEQQAPRTGAAADRLSSAMRYALLAPGKRVRPVLLLMCATLLGAEESTALAPACAIEMVHAASLIFDDLPCMDDAQLRRGLPATHVRYGEDVAVLAGVALLNQAFAVLAQADELPAATRLEMVRQLSQAVGPDGLVAGQASDLRSRAGGSPMRLQDVHRRKTSALFEAAAVLGGLAGQAAPRELEALRSAAGEFGLAFQALDDLADGDGLPALVGSSGAGREAEHRAAEARAHLRAAGPRLEPLADYVELLLRPHGRVEHAARVEADR